MLVEPITAAPQGQSKADNPDGELLDVLHQAASAGLIDKDRAPHVAALVAIGSLTGATLKDEVVSLLAKGDAPTRALDAIAHLFDPTDVIELRTVNPAGGGGPSINGRLGDPTERAASEDFIRRHNGRLNIYVGINPRHVGLAGTARAANAGDVVGRRSIVLDLDNKDAPSMDAGWKNTLATLVADFSPALVLDSGNGTHVWLDVATMDRLDAETAVASLKGAMAALGADDLSDLPRVARLPFTVNLPNAGKRQRGAVPRLAVPAGAAAMPAALRPAPPAASALCSGLKALATKLGLPGKPGATAASTASRAASHGGEKTPHAALSPDLLRRALQELPNLPGGPIDDRPDWVRLAHAVKGASIAGGFEVEGREAFIEWSLQWGGDPDEPGRVWDGIVRPNTGWGALMTILRTHNPEGAARVKDEENALIRTNATAQTHAAVMGATFAPIAAIATNQIPPRRWLYGRSAIAGFVSFLVAPGGAGKSALAMVEAVAMASGRELLPGEKPVRPLRIWLHNAEDDIDEMKRRQAAVLLHFGLTHADLNSSLFMTSGREMKLQLARMGRDGPEIVPGVVDALVERLVTDKIDVLTLDPLGALHTLPENSNEAANLLSGALREVAHRADVSVIVLHHSGKAAAMDMDAAGAGASRGASAFVDAARVVRQVVRMTEKEAARYGIADADRRGYLRIENGKANLARAEGGRWLRMVDVALGNGAGLWPLGDRVGVVERWTPPQVLSGSASDLLKVQTAVAALATPPRLNPKSPDWVGHTVARALGLNTGPAGGAQKDRTPEEAAAHSRVRALLDGWLRDGGLLRHRGRDPNTRHVVELVAIGRPAIVQDEIVQDAAPNPSDEDTENARREE